MAGAEAVGEGGGNSSLATPPVTESQLTQEQPLPSWPPGHHPEREAVRLGGAALVENAP